MPYIRWDIFRNKYWSIHHLLSRPQIKIRCFCFQGTKRHAIFIMNMNHAFRLSCVLRWCACSVSLLNLLMPSDAYMRQWTYIVGSDNGLSLGRHHAIISTNAWISLIGPWGTHVSEILIEIHTFSFKEIRLKLSSAKWWSFCLDLNLLIDIW